MCDMTEKKMKNGDTVAALFDLDGVVFDTETQYSVFWGEIGREYHPETDGFELKIKGQTLVQIYDRWFAGNASLQASITDRLNDFERRMQYDYIPGVQAFLQALKEAGVRTAVVTSSNLEKMRRVGEAHPELETLFDEILTSERFTRSKPAPDCYLLGAEVLHVGAGDCVVFEDSFHGLQAGRSAGMKVMGLATTHPAEAIRDKCDEVIPDFCDMTPEKMLRLLR